MNKHNKHEILKDLTQDQINQVSGGTKSGDIMSTYLNKLRVGNTKGGGTKNGSVISPIES